MRDWALRLGDPLALTIAVDQRLGIPNYLNDHIWELDLRGGEPPSLTIRTTYGLRARSMRLFYRFTEAGKAFVDPNDFHRPPTVRRFHPNFLLLEFAPIEGLDVTAEFWVPESQVIAGRLKLVNSTRFPRHVEFELCGLLTPLDGRSLGLVKHQMVNVPGGETGELQPVVFMGGSPRHSAGPHPALTMAMDFETGTSRTLVWACGARGTTQDSFDLARKTVARPWDAERARIELLDARETLDVYTGNPEWDAALALSQQAAHALFYPANDHLPNPSFVRSRQPDGGYSRAGDGSDYPPSWAGQSALDAYYLKTALPLDHDLHRGLLDNFIAVQKPDGSIDNKPGLAGQRLKFLATPLLAATAWRCYEEAPDDAFLSRVFPKLMAFLHAWFAPERDHDGDGIPEWEHLLQTGFEDNPLFDLWFPWSQSLDVGTLTSPELEAFLAGEVASLVRMAAKLGFEGQAAELRDLEPRLASSIASSWNGRSSLFTYRDRLTGSSWTGRSVGSCRGEGEVKLRKASFDNPVRLIIRIESKEGVTGRPTVEIAGYGRARESEDGSASEGADSQLTERFKEEFRRNASGLIAVTRHVYSRIERITAEGLDPSYRLTVRTLETTGEDMTLFAPLWAGVLDADRARMIAERLARPEDGFNRPYGIPALPASPGTARLAAREKAEAESLAMGVHLPWNNLIGEGLLSYGFHQETVRLITRNLNAIVFSLKHSRAFYERYHAETGGGLGERGALTGLVPLGLFLKALGVSFISQRSVRLEGINPFPAPVTLIYRGLKVVRGLDSTTVAFPNGQTVTVTDPSPCVVSL
jgi:hypothetical protein